MTLLEQSLSQQLGINNREINKRKKMLDFTDSDVNVLKKFKPLFDMHMDMVVSEFYQRQIEEPEIALTIGDAETLRRLQSSMRRYIIELFQGQYDQDYVNRRLRIGKVHQRIGVSPKLYISAVYILQKVINRVVLAYSGDNSLQDEVPALMDALNKLLMFDIQLVFDTYIHSLVNEVESARSQLQVYASSLEKEIEDRTRQLHEMSRKDELTGLCNHRGLIESLSHELASAERYAEPLSIAYFDLNNFKQLNDEYGHQVGDRILEGVGKVISQSIREIDIGCRHGGDEFCIIFPRTGIDEASSVCERLVENYREYAELPVTFSIGMAVTGNDEYIDMDTLFKRADRRMYASKESARKASGYYLTDREGTRLLAKD